MKISIGDVLETSSNSIRQKISNFNADHGWLLRWIRMTWLVVTSLIMIKVSPFPETNFNEDCPLPQVALL